MTSHFSRPVHFTHRVGILAMMTATLLLAPLARAENERPARTTTTATARPVPPAFPDTAHVRQGCYISTVTYLAKFTAAFPGEFGAPLSVHPRPYPTPHTVALITWRGEWWVRDEFLHLIRVNLPVASREITQSVERRAAAALERRALRLSSDERSRIASFELREAGAVAAAHEVASAAQLLPFATEVFHIKSRGREIPVLFFRPAPGAIAVYDPHFGTASAETNIAGSAAVVALVAALLGYPAATVRSDFRPPMGELIAARGSFSGGIAR